MREVIKLKISVIVPIYNVEQYLEAAIESILRQSYAHIEILLINDGSTDNSKAICESYAAHYEFIYLIDKKNGGLSDARNVGIQKATGEYLLFLDSDDYWEEDLLKVLVTNLCTNKKTDYLFFRHSEYYETSKIKMEKFINIDSDAIIQLHGLDILSYILEKEKYFAWYAWSAIIRTDFIKKNKLLFEIGRSYEDVLWTPTVLLKVNKVGFINEALYVYRRDREGQITSRLSYNNLRDNIYISDYWVRNSNHLIDREDLEKMLINNVISRYFYAIWFSGFLNRKERKLIWKDLKEHNYLLYYHDTLIQKITFVLLSSIGMSGTSYLFRFFISTQRKLIK